jgi:hypothetical protein
MTDPELLASGPERRLPPAVRHALAWALAAAALAAVILVAVRHSGHNAIHARAAVPAAAPITTAATTSAPAAAPVAADLARVVVDPARHRLRLIFTVFNAESSRVVLLKAGADEAGLHLRRVSFARFGASGSWQPAGLPLALATGQSVHVQLDYGVRSCPAPATARLLIPAELTERQRGRINIDLATLVPPHSWPRGFINVLCPMSSR